MNAFHFYSRLDLTILLDEHATDAKQLLKGIESVPDASIYFHTHKYLLQYHYLIPVPPNDFANWALTSLNDDVLGEQLSSIDIMQSGSIPELRERIAEVVRSYVKKNPRNKRECPPGEEFYFMATQTVILPTPIVSRSLEEFSNHIEQISLHSLYYHMFDSRLRLGRGENDFSAWFRGIGKPELADKVRTLDPYLSTLEGLRAQIKALVKKYE
ncbi:MAG: DUF5752 family protein [Bacteroidota bacterium]